MSRDQLYFSVDTADCQISDLDKLSAPYGNSGRYEAAVGSDFRKQRRTVLREEDDVLKFRDRDRVDSKSLDIQRNSGNAAWSVRKHNDFVATHTFNCQSEDATLDEDIEGLVAEWSEPEEFDIRARFGLEDHIRLDETQRTVRGDCLIQRIRNGRVQLIEADRIRNPDLRKYRGDWKNGCLQNANGRITHYAIHKRKNGGFEFEKVLRASEVFHFGYYMRHDQRRGISPMLAVVNNLEQTQNAVKFAQAKQVISQIFGLVVSKDSPESKPVDLTAPFIMELNKEEKAEFLSDDTPSSEFDSFLRHVISMSMKALDLPYNFYDESHTNFFGSRAALNLYLMSCLAKRRGVRNLLHNLTKFRLNYEITRGRLRLPRSMDLDKLYRKYCEWIPIGMQWWNPQQEAKAAEIMLRLGLTTRAEIRKQTHGDSWFSLADRIEQEQVRLANMNFLDQGDGGSSLDIDSIVQQVTDGVIERLQEMKIAA